MLETSTGLRFVLWSTVLCGAVIAIACGVFLWMPNDVFETRKNAFELIVNRTLLSMFTTLATAVLSYVLARPLVAALATHLRDRN